MKIANMNRMVQFIFEGKDSITFGGFGALPRVGEQVRWDNYSYFDELSEEWITKDGTWDVAAVRWNMTPDSDGGVSTVDVKLERISK